MQPKSCDCLLLFFFFYLWMFVFCVWLLIYFFLDFFFRIVCAGTVDSYRWIIKMNQTNIKLKIHEHPWKWGMQSGIRIPDIYICRGRDIDSLSRLLLDKTLNSIVICKISPFSPRRRSRRRWRLALTTDWCTASRNFPVTLTHNVVTVYVVVFVIIIARFVR